MYMKCTRKIGFLNKYVVSLRAWAPPNFFYDNADELHGNMASDNTPLKLGPLPKEISG